MAHRHARLVVEAVLSRWPWRFPRRFGFVEVVASTGLGSIDFVRRHMTIVNEVEALRQQLGRRIDVLDFGGAHSPLSDFLRMYGLGRHYRVTLADVDQAAIARARLRPPLQSRHVLDPSARLPFEDGAFDVVVSSDVFEHIPVRERPRWASELQRVSRHGQVHNIPCDGDQFVSSRTDAEFQRWHVARFERPEPWTAEHIANGVPRVDELKELFPEARLKGSANAALWLRTMKDEAARRSSVRRLTRALAYALLRQRLDARGPYKACLLTAGTVAGGGTVVARPSRPLRLTKRFEVIYCPFACPRPTLPFFPQEH